MIAAEVSVEQYQLQNCLTVMLNEYKYSSGVYGVVIVKGGGKQDPSDATGIAHYLEHMLFKGTTELGTVNYLEEKKYMGTAGSLTTINLKNYNQDTILVMNSKNLPGYT